MSTTKTVSDFASRLADSLKSLAKIIILSRPVKAPRKCAKPSDSIIILGNGPSLKTTVAGHLDILKARPTVAVNFMANAPEFREIRPDYYVLADPHFFTGLHHDNVSSLWENISSVDWPMTLCVPRQRLKLAKMFIRQSANISINTFNFVAAEGFSWFENFLYSCRLAMPRPRNVLIPAIMTAIAAGYKNIYVCGADHSWLETIRVTDENHVVSVQPHFYADSKKELQRSETEYRGYHLHDILLSFYTAFRSYHIIQNFARSKGVNIFNATPGSFIDAFPRKSL